MFNQTCADHIYSEVEF